MTEGLIKGLLIIRIKIRTRKKKLKLVPVAPGAGALGAKAQQLAALQASIASKLSQVPN